MFVITHRNVLRRHVQAPDCPPADIKADPTAWKVRPDVREEANVHLISGSNSRHGSIVICENCFGDQFILLLACE